MLYTYQITAGMNAGVQIEIEHPASQPALTETKYNGRTVKVKRIISGPTNFILKGGCWARDSYSAGVQSMPTKEDRASFNKKP